MLNLDMSQRYLNLANGTQDVGCKKHQRKLLPGNPTATKLHISRNKEDNYIDNVNATHSTPKPYTQSKNTVQNTTCSGTQEVFM